MKSDVQAVRELLAAHDPAGALAQGARRDESIALATWAKIGHQSQDNSEAAIRPTRRVSLRAATIAVTALVALLVWLVPVFLPIEQSPSPSSSSLRLTNVVYDGRPNSLSAVLLASAAAAERNATPPGPHHVWYQKGAEGSIHITAGEHPYSVFVPSVTETWIAPDGSGRIRTQRGTPIWPSSEDRERWHAAGRPALPEPGEGDDRFSPGELWLPDDDWPTDADRLERFLDERVEARAERSAADEMFVMIHERLRAWPISPELRAALLRVLSRMPGVDAIGRASDRAGRRGYAFAFNDGGGGGLETRTVLIIDPSSGRLLGEEEVLLEPGKAVAAAPTTVSFTTFLVEGTVSDVLTVPSSAVPPQSP